MVVHRQFLSLITSCNVGRQMDASQAAADAEGLLHTYYNILDNERHNLAQVYRNDSSIVYNGQPFNAVTFAQFYTTMPQTHHTMMCFDCHPLANDGGSMVTSSGAVRLATDSQKHGFSQTFIMRKDAMTGTVYIESDSFRLVT